MLQNVRPDDCDGILVVRCDYRADDIAPPEASTQGKGAKLALAEKAVT